MQQQPNIIVVEDEAITAMDIQARLEKLGYKVPAIIDTGEEAIEAAKKLHPDLILMDISLKGAMDGTEAAARITRLLHTPIIFLTAYHDIDTFNRAKLSSPFGYLTKPFETHDLRNAIELALFKQKGRKSLAAEERYHSIMENAPYGIFITEDNLITEVNKQMENILGCKSEKIIGKEFKNFIDSTELDKANEINKSNKIRITKPDGTKIEAELISVLVETDTESFTLGILKA